MNRFERPWYRKPRFGPKMPRIPRGHGLVYCPERNEKVLYSECLECPNFKVWEEGDIERCKYEYEELKRIGHYSDGEEQWLRHLKESDPETYRRLMEEKENQKRVRAEMEAERAKNEKESKPEAEKEPESENDEEDVEQPEDVDEFIEEKDDDLDNEDEDEDLFDDDEYYDFDEDEEEDEWQ